MFGRGTSCAGLKILINLWQEKFRVGVELAETKTDNLRTISSFCILLSLLASVSFFFLFPLSFHFLFLFPILIFPISTSSPSVSHYSLPFVSLSSFPFLFSCLSFSLSISISISYLFFLLFTFVLLSFLFFSFLFFHPFSYILYVCTTYADRCNPCKHASYLAQGKLRNGNTKSFIVLVFW